MLDLVLSNLGWILGGIGAIALAIFTAFVRKSGSDAEKAKQAKADAKATQTVNTVRNETKAKSDTDLDKEFKQWERK